MQTVEMKPVYPVIPDSLKEKDDFLLAEVDEKDSAAVGRDKVEPGDSVYAITKTKEKFNLDQDLYMWYFREMLVLPDVRVALEKKSEKKNEEPEKEGEKKSGSLFKNPFKKKQNDSTATAPVSAPEEPKKKGGLFKKNKSEQPAKKQDPAKKKDDGDGF